MRIEPLKGISLHLCVELVRTFIKFVFKFISRAGLFIYPFEMFSGLSHSLLRIQSILAALLYKQAIRHSHAHKIRKIHIKNTKKKRYFSIVSRLLLRIKTHPFLSTWGELPLVALPKYESHKSGTRLLCIFHDGVIIQNFLCQRRASFTSFFWCIISCYHIVDNACILRYTERLRIPCSIFAVISSQIRIS